MERKLMLLSNPGFKGVNYAPSVFQATERYRNFFASPLGGLWEDNEIIEMPNGLSENEQCVWMSSMIDTLNKFTDYSMVVFTGHGGTVIKGYEETECIQLPGGGLFPINNLLGLNDNRIKRTVIIDACRSYVRLYEHEQLEKEQQVLMDLTKNLILSDCRDYFNELIDAAQPHVELVQSTEIGEPANATQNGSAFCDALFAEIYEKGPLWNNVALTGVKQNSKTIKDVIDFVCKRKEVLEFGQMPQFRTSSEATEFPLYVVRRRNYLL